MEAEKRAPKKKGDSNRGTNTAPRLFIAERRKALELAETKRKIGG